VRRQLGQIGGVLRAHWLFALIFIAGATLRILVEIAYRYPFVQPDSHRYLTSAILLEPDQGRPSGYSLFLRLVPGWRDLWPVPIPQHLLGLAMGAAIYWLLVSRGVPRWGSALATIPILLDPYQVAIEHYVLSDTVFEAFLLGGFCALSIRRRLSWRLAALGGLLLGCAIVTRAVAEVVLPVAFLVVLLGQARWRPAIVFLLSVAIPVGGYALWYHHDYGAYSTGRFPENILYERVVRFADCSELDVPAYERPLCPDTPKNELRGWFYYGWSRKSPWRHLAPPPGLTSAEVLRDFDRRAISQQPGRYARLIVGDALRGFRLREDEYADGSGMATHWRFGAEGQYHAIEVIPGMPPATELAINEPLARKLGVYSHVYLPGPVYAALLLTGLAAAAGIGRAAQSGMRATVALFSVSALLLLLTSTAISIFSWRYQLPQFLLLPPAGALGLVALLGREPADNRLSVGETARRLAAAIPFVRLERA
jgi:hypothetical protein